MKPDQRTYGSPIVSVVDFERPCENSRLAHAILGLCGEAGELASLIKRDDMGADHLDILDEIGDVRWYSALALDAVGHTPEQADAWNRKKLARRQTHGKDKENEREWLRQLDACDLLRSTTYADAIAEALVRHWEASPTCRAALPPHLNALIRTWRAASGREEIAP
jgi:NTP pyrophosphatase (non-canonical NTP hydrolase)